MFRSARVLSHYAILIQRAFEWGIKGRTEEDARAKKKAALSLHNKRAALAFLLPRSPTTPSPPFFVARISAARQSAPFVFAARKFLFFLHDSLLSRHRLVPVYFSPSIPALFLLRFLPFVSAAKRGKIRERAR